MEYRQELRRAIIAALLKAKPSSASGASVQRVKDTAPDTPSDREELRAAAAVLLGISISEVTDDRLDSLIQDVTKSAEDEARAVVDHLNTFVEHFETIGCDCSKIGQYFRQANQTLASLYYAVSRSNPSPTGVKKLALRYALDARVPVSDPVERYRLKRCEDGWEIREYPRLASPAIPFPPRLIRDRFVVSVLDCVFPRELNKYRLMELIEFLLKGPPSKNDILPSAGKQRFTFQIAEEGDGGPVVTLRIGKTEVELPKRRDVHRLLHALCETSDLQLTGPKCREELNVSNASQACSLIRRSLTQVQPEAGDWLLTGPIRWATGKAPRLRPLGSSGRNSRE